jgi:hypothetical protein
MNGIYDLYQQYLAEAYAPKVSTTPAYDPFWFLKQQTQGEGGDNTGGITTLSPQQTRDRAMQMEFDAAALRDQYGNVVGGLTEAEQILMDKMTGKAPLTNMQKATLGYGFAMPGTGIISMANLYAQRAMEARRAAEEMAALQRQQDVRRAASGSSGSDTFSFSDNSGYGGTGTSSPSNVGPGGTLGGGV